MAKIVLPEVGPGFNRNVINENFDKIEEALNDLVLYRDSPVGEPNQMESDLDMNGMRVYNLPEPVLEHEAARFKDLKDTIENVQGAVQQVEEARDITLAARDVTLEARNEAVVAASDALISAQNALASELAASESAQEANDLVVGFGIRSYETKALMDADLSPAAGLSGIVTNDPNPALNGWYNKVGASGTGSWTYSASQPVLPGTFEPVKLASDRTGWNIVGILTSSESDPVTPTTDIISFGLITITSGAIYGVSRQVEPIVGLSVPQGQAAYVDMDAPLNASGRLDPMVTTTGYTTDISSGGFITDRRVFLYINGTAEQTGGPLGQQAVVKPENISKALDNRTTRPAWAVLGNVEDIRDIGSTKVVTTGILTVASGTAKTVYRINAIPSTTVPSGQALFVDLDGPVDGDGRLTAQVTVNGYANLGSITPAGSFVDDKRIYLLINDATSSYGGELTAIRQKRQIANPIWHISGGTGVVSYNPTTRTLSWNGSLVLPFGNAARVVVEPGSIVIPAGTFLTIYLDLAEALIQSGQTTPISAIKVASYNGADAQSRSIGQSGALPMFLLTTATRWRSINGFPEAVNTEIPPVSSLADDDIIVKVGTETVSVFVKGNNNYTETILLHQVNAFNPADPFGNRDVWRIAGAYEASLIDIEALTFSRGRRILQAGEVECAIIEVGAPDYIGGYHGDEILIDIKMFLDGSPINFNTPATLVGKVFQYVQPATLYQCNTQTPVATHSKVGKIYHTESGSLLSLRQGIEWDVAMVVRASMLTMLPIKRLAGDTVGEAITDTAIRAPMWSTEDVSTAGFPTVNSLGDLPDAQIWGSTSGISASVRMIKYPDIASRNFYIANDVVYNKFYYSVAGNVDGSANYTTTVGEIWDVESEILISTSV